MELKEELDLGLALDYGTVRVRIRMRVTVRVTVKVDDSVLVRVGMKVQC